MKETLLIVPMALNPPDWTPLACDAFSLVSVSLAGAVLVFGVVLMILEARFKPVGFLKRAASAVALAGCILLILVILFPDCLHGPYGRLSHEAERLISHVVEAQPMMAVIEQQPQRAALFLALPLMAWLLALWRVFVAADAERWLWVSLLILIGGAICLQFWQIRASPLANAYAGIVFAWWSARWIDRAKAIKFVWLRAFVRTLPILVVVGLPIFFHITVKSMTEASSETSLQKCPLTAIVPVLNAPSLTEDGPQLIAAHINIGPALLLRTPHQVLAAPYHRNTDGLRAIMEIFGSDLERAHQTVEARDVDLLYVCGSKTDFLSSPDPDSPTLYSRLQSGEVPDWLENIPIPGAHEGEHLYRVLDR